MKIFGPLEGHRATSASMDSKLITEDTFLGYIETDREVPDEATGTGSPGTLTG